MYANVTPRKIKGTSASEFTVAFATADVIVAWRQLNGQWRVRIESAKITQLQLPAGFAIRESGIHASAVVAGPGSVTKIVALCAALYAVTP